MSRLTIDHIPKHVLKDKLTLTIDWVKMSFTVHDNAGSAAWYHILKGWESPYPETTGYLIPTMLSAAEFLDDADLRNLAVAQGSWLAGLQMPSGAFPGGLSPKGSPIVFDCGQILFGLLALHALDHTESMESVIIALCRWLYSTVSDERAWKEMCFLPGYIPAYDTRVIWSLLEARRAGLISFQDEWAYDRIGFLLHDTQPDYWNDRYGFAPGKAAYTHTIAYTLRGLLESAELLGDATLLRDACRMMDQIITTEGNTGGIAGAYTAGWEGDKSFICITGHAQLALCGLRLFELTDNALYRDFANRRTDEILNAQRSSGWQGLKGGIPGSLPLMGKYMPWRFPNWAAKFYLDLLLWYLVDQPPSQNP